MSPDRINDLNVQYVSRDTEYDVLLGCQDRALRVLQVKLKDCEDLI